MPHAPEQSQNHDTKQAIEQQKEAGIKSGKYQSRPSVGTSSYHS